MDRNRLLATGIIGFVVSILGCVTPVLVARDISHRSYMKMVQNITLAFLFNGIGIPIAAAGLIYPVWAMVAMAVSVTAIFIKSLWGRPRLFTDAIQSVGQPVESAAPQAA